VWCWADRNSSGCFCAHVPLTRIRSSSRDLDAGRLVFLLPSRLTRTPRLPPQHVRTLLVAPDEENKVRPLAARIVVDAMRWVLARGAQMPVHRRGKKKCRSAEPRSNPSGSVWGCCTVRVRSFVPVVERREESEMGAFTPVYMRALSSFVDARCGRCVDGRSPSIGFTRIRRGRGRFGF
jgi:hypothetical protein